MDTTHDFRHVRDHEVEHLDSFFIYRLEAGPLNCNFRD